MTTPRKEIEEATRLVFDWAATTTSTGVGRNRLVGMVTSALLKARREAWEEGVRFCNEQEGCDFGLDANPYTLPKEAP